MFFFFSNGFGLVGSIIVSIAVTLLLLYACSGCLPRPGSSSRCKTAGALAAKPLTGCKSRLGHPRFSRKTGRAAPLPFLIKQATHSPYFRTSPGAGVGLVSPDLFIGRHLRSCRCLPAGCGAGCVRHRRGRPRPGSILFGAWGAPELSYCFGVCCCADATQALTSNAGARQHGQMLPHDSFLFFPVLPQNISLVRPNRPRRCWFLRRKPRPRSSAAPTGAGGTSSARCANDAPAAADLKRTHPRVWPKGYGGRKNARFGRHHMFASICNHYNRNSVE